jgi:ABC-type glycerol-3-phosphate transport system substrate-binding protein
MEELYKRGMTVHRNHRLLFRGSVSATLVIAAVTAFAGWGGASAAGSGPIDTSPITTSKGTLNILDYPNVWQGFTKATSSGSSAISSWYTYYGKIWAHDFPRTTILESTVPNAAAEVERTILGVSAGNPPDLIGVDAQLPTLVQKGALTNLDSYFKAYGIKVSSFTPALAKYARYNGHWFAMPGVNMPTVGDLMYVPSYVKSAGLNPNSPPRTFDQLFAMTKKVTKFAPNGNLERIGFDLMLPGPLALAVSNTRRGCSATIQTSLGQPRRATT